MAWHFIAQIFQKKMPNMRQISNAQSIKIAPFYIEVESSINNFMEYFSGISSVF